MTLTCERCGDEITFGQPFTMIQDENGGTAYTHLTRALGGLELFLHKCPQPIPAAEGGDEEVPMPATSGGLASPQVNSGSALENCPPASGSQAPEGTGAEPHSSLPREMPVFMAGPAPLSAFSGEVEMAQFNDTSVVIGQQLALSILDALERIALIEEAAAAVRVEVHDGVGVVVVGLEELRAALRAGRAPGEADRG